MAEYKNDQPDHIQPKSKLSNGFHPLDKEDMRKLLPELTEAGLKVLMAYVLLPAKELPREPGSMYASAVSASTNKKLMAVTGMSEPSVIAGKKRLVERGELEKLAPNMYRIVRYKKYRLIQQDESGDEAMSDEIDDMAKKSLARLKNFKRDLKILSETEEILASADPSDLKILSEYLKILSENLKILSVGSEQKSRKSNNDKGLQDLEDPFKEKEKEDLSLSPDPVAYFYKEIGQAKISKRKEREGEKVLKRLRKDRFSDSDIQYAADWTVKNAKEELYDFSILEHTIGQALAFREKEQAEEREALKRDKEKSAERKRQRQEEREQAEIESRKQSLSPEEKSRLRERAEAELMASGDYKTEFISSALIAIKENELLRRELSQ